MQTSCFLSYCFWKDLSEQNFLSFSGLPCPQDMAKTRNSPCSETGQDYPVTVYVSYKITITIVVVENNPIIHALNPFATGFFSHPQTLPSHIWDTCSERVKRNKIVQMDAIQRRSRYLGSQSEFRTTGRAVYRSNEIYQIITYSCNFSRINYYRTIF